MIRIVESGANALQLIEMKDMKPLQVGIINDDSVQHDGHVVMRTSGYRFEVMDMTSPEVGGYWTGGAPDIKVRLLQPGEKVTVELYND